MLRFEYNIQDTSVEIFMDAEGRDLLISRLQKLRVPGDHDHLMTPSWSGWELSEDGQRSGNDLINQVNLGIPRSD